MQKKNPQTKIEQIVAKGHKRLNDYYNKKLKKSKYNKNPEYIPEVRIDNSQKVF